MNKSRKRTQNWTSRERRDTPNRNHNHGSSSSQPMKQKSGMASSTSQPAWVSNYQNGKRQKMDPRGGGNISNIHRNGATVVSTKPLTMVKVEHFEKNHASKFSEQKFDRQKGKAMLPNPHAFVGNNGVHKSNVSDVRVTKIAATSPTTGSQKGKAMLPNPHAFVGNNGVHKSNVSDVRVTKIAATSPTTGASIMVASSITEGTAQMAPTFVNKVTSYNFSVPKLSRSGQCLYGSAGNNQATFISGFGYQWKPFQDFPEKGQSSNSKNSSKFVDDLKEPGFVCGICIERKAVNETFSIKGCSHTYCTNCVNKYVASKVQENVSNILCPASNCQGMLEPEYCRSILPRKVFDTWCDALCEAAILGCQKFYCPFKDCSGMLIDDGAEQIRKSECPHCRRLFCAQCMAPWHSGIDCKEFQKLHKDELEREDILLMKLAEKKLWKRCPKCRFYVERTQGCKYMRCRCGTYFCYGCGTTAVDMTLHYCHNCRA